MRTVNVHAAKTGLSGLLEAVERGEEHAFALLERAGIDGTRRAETLTQTEFRKLAEVWRAD